MYSTYINNGQYFTNYNNNNYELTYDKFKRVIHNILLYGIRNVIIKIL